MYQNQKKDYQNIKSKICKRCNIEKNISEFTKDKNSKDGLYSYCKECKSKSVLEWHHNNPDHIKRYKKKYSRLRKSISARIYIAINKNLPHDSIDDLYNYLKPIEDKGVCECCGKNFKHGQHNSNDSASIDRIIPELGYVINNVALICSECNRQKGDTSLEKMKHIVNWIEFKINA